MNQQNPLSRRAPLFLALAMALLGAAFSAISTVDFIEHLDRQVHSIHCSIIPGAGAEFGESGCKTVMLSPYSSFFRQSLWGGLPVALWSLAVFAFLAWRAAYFAWRGRQNRSEALFFTAACAFPVLMSLIYGYLAISEVGAVCKVCAGIYIASAGALGGALWALKLAEPDGSEDEAPGRIWAKGIIGGTLFVLILTLIYLFMAPKAEAKTCGELVKEEDAASVMLSFQPLPGKRSAVELLDPLCPSCKGFDQRLSASGLRGELDLKTLLFPLDSTCNWMVSQSLHPGACAVSEAMLCAGPLAKGREGGAHAASLRVLEWAFEHQEALREEAKRDEAGLRRRIEQQFPEVKGCLGGTLVKNRMVKSLRWAVANAVPVLTPQLFVGKSRLCDEDTDLGLEYTLSKLLKEGAR